MVVAPLMKTATPKRRNVRDQLDKNNPKYSPIATTVSRTQTYDIHKMDSKASSAAYESDVEEDDVSDSDSSKDSENNYDKGNNVAGGGVSDTKIIVPTVTRSRKRKTSKAALPTRVTTISSGKVEGMIDDETVGTASSSSLITAAEAVSSSKGADDIPRGEGKRIMLIEPRRLMQVGDLYTSIYVCMYLIHTHIRTCPNTHLYVCGG